MATQSAFAKRRRRKPGDLAGLQRTIWAGLLTAEELASDPDPQIRLRSLHAIAQLAGSYLKVIEAKDLAGRIEAIEAELAGTDGRAKMIRLTWPEENHA